MSSIISVQNLGKKYVLTHQTQERYTALRDVLANGAKHLAQKLRHPFTIEENDPTHEEFWALKDLSFDIHQGDRVGIIGRNGAGKSTLLKILSRITEPTTGQVKIRGRVASLLEVGTGFHPELTGRENVYLNGAILGMSKAEIGKKFDEIVAFAEVEKFLDTPVKRYSSGMYVRLAFSVAAHLEPEILIVDEVLAVGDVQFQKKCLGKMESVGNEGRTVLFVSHNTGALSTLCTKGILLKQGQVVANGNIADVLRDYTNVGVSEGQRWEGDAGDETVRLLRTWVKSLGPEGIFDTTHDIEIGIEVNLLKSVEGLILGFTLFSEFEYELAYVLYDDAEKKSEVRTPGVMQKKFVIPGNTLAQGGYRIEFDVGIHMIKRIIGSEGGLTFSVDNLSGLGFQYVVPKLRGRAGLFRPNWSTKS